MNTPDTPSFSRIEPEAAKAPLAPLPAHDAVTVPAAARTDDTPMGQSKKPS